MQEQKLIEIYPAVGTPFDHYFNVHALMIYGSGFLLCSAVLAGLMYCLYHYFLSMKKRTYRALARLKKAPCATEAEAKEVFSQVAGIIRGFLIQKYELSTFGMTDTELFSFLQTRITDPVILKDSEYLLLGTHHVRFSHDHVQARMCEQLIQDALRFIKTFPS